MHPVLNRGVAGCISVVILNMGDDLPPPAPPGNER